MSLLTACGGDDSTPEPQGGFSIPEDTTTTELVPPPTEAEEPEEPGVVDPCEHVSSRDVAAVMGEPYLDGVAGRPADGIRHCLWESGDRADFVDIVVFASADDYPGDWDWLTTAAPSEAEMTMILDLLGIDIMSYGTPTWVHWGCWSPEPEQRSDQFAILMYGSEVPLTPEEDLGLLDLLGGVDRACAAENAAESA